MPHISAIYIKRRKGQPAEGVDTALLLAGQGLEGDMRAGDASLLGTEILSEIEEQHLHGLCMKKFVANIYTAGVNAADLVTGSRLRIGKALLEITKVGKPCYDDCELHDSHCPLHNGAVFAAVLECGTVHTGDDIVIIQPMHS